MKPGPRRRILVTGVGGLLGGRLAALLALEHDVTGGVSVSPAPAGILPVPLDLLSLASLEGAFESVRPDVIVHAAALADAEVCEREPDRAHRTNVEATGALAHLCRRRGARLIVLSTDMVLAGDRSFAREDEVAEPLSVYGRTKLLAEEAALQESPDACVLRVALVHGRGHGRRSTASEAIGWALREGRKLRLFTDQLRTPVDPESVAHAIRRVIASGAGGRFHIGGPVRLSRYELGLRVAHVLGRPGDGIEGVSQSAAPMVAPRPRDASMDSSRARRELGWEPRPLEAGIAEGRPAAD